MSKQLKPIPKFSNEADERAFWESPKNDSTEYVDWSKARLAAFHKLRTPEHDECAFEAKLTALRAAIDEGDASGVAEGDVFEQAREANI
jgi:hypothetical protein